MGDYTAGKDWKIAKEHRMLETAYQLFCKKGIEAATMPEIAQVSGVGRATLYRYFPTKLDLVVTIGTWKWQEYIEAYRTPVSAEQIAAMSGAEYLRFYLDSFIELYRSHSDILRFNYEFNSFLRLNAGTAEQRQPYMKMIERLGAEFHELYRRGIDDGTLNAEITEESMFSASFHIMLAAATRYAVGLVYVMEGANPAQELIMLEELLLSRFVRTGSKNG